MIAFQVYFIVYIDGEYEFGTYSSRVLSELLNGYDCLPSLDRAAYSKIDRNGGLNIFLYFKSKE